MKCSYTKTPVSNLLSMTSITILVINNNYNIVLNINTLTIHNWM